MNNVIRIFQLLLVVMLPATGLAQGVGGYITTASGAPISGARVTLFNADTSMFSEVRSGPSGEYFIRARTIGSYRLGIAALGYEYKERGIGLSMIDTTPRIDFTLATEEQQGVWRVLVDPGERLGGTNSAVLLPDGRIFYCHDTRDPVIFDPRTNSVQKGPQSPKIQGCHAVRLLQDGRMIFVGGADQEVYGPGIKQVKTLDPVQNIWTIQSDINDYRWYPTMTQLPDGELLIAGGGGLNNPVRVKTSETMDPTTLRWSPAGDIEIGNEVSPVALLYTGEVLMTNRPPQLYNPTTRQWHRAADFIQGNRIPNGDHSDHEIALLPDGRVVAIGYKSFTPGSLGSIVEIYDPQSNSWQLGSTFAPARSRTSVVMLPDRKILAIGGYKEDSSDATPTNKWGYMKLTDQYNAESDWLLHPFCNGR